MRIVYFLLGKSSSGKTFIMNLLLSDQSLNLKRIKLHTNRPRRDGEDDSEYYFEDSIKYNEKTFDKREYKTKSEEGIWAYWCNEDEIYNSNTQYIVQGPLDMLKNYIEYSKNHEDVKVVPIMIECNEKKRLIRMIEREDEKVSPNWIELMRRTYEDELRFVENVDLLNDCIYIYNGDNINKTLTNLKNIIKLLELQLTIGVDGIIKSIINEHNIELDFAEKNSIDICNNVIQKIIETFKIPGMTYYVDNSKSGMNKSNEEYNIEILKNIRDEVEQLCSNNTYDFRDLTQSEMQERISKYVEDIDGVSIESLTYDEESKIANIRLDFNVKYIDELIEIIPDTQKSNL